MLSKDYNWSMKNEVRAASFAPFMGKRYSTIVDLPGNQCLSPEEAIRQNVIATNGQFILAENDHGQTGGRIYQEIEDRMRKLDARFTLFHDNIEQMDFDGEVGLVNCDLMTQPCGFDLEFINRVPYQNGAGLICTFQNPATRARSKFMNEVDEMLGGINTTVWDYWRKQYRLKQYGLTVNRNGDLVRETLMERKSGQQFYRLGEAILACIIYGMRNHDFRLNKIITYSGNQKSLAFRMTTVILTGVCARDDHKPSRLAPAPGRDKHVVDAATLTNMKEYFHG